MPHAVLAGQGASPTATPARERADPMASYWTNAWLKGTPAAGIQERADDLTENLEAPGIDSFESLRYYSAT